VAFSSAIDRRAALKRAAAGAAGLGLVAAGCQTMTSKSTSSAPKPPCKISLAEWSLHRALQGGRLDHLDFPKVAKEDYGIPYVEYVNIFFRNKQAESGHVAELKKRCDDLGVKSLLIMCDGEGAIGDPDDQKRKQAVENHYKWVDAAVALGCHSIRVNAQSKGTPEEQRRLAADGLRRLVEFGAKQNINVIVENHGGLSSNGAWLASVMRTVNHPRCGTLPDFGNFDLGNGEKYDRYRGVAEMIPFAKACSAKSHEFDQRGEEIFTDYHRLMRIVYGSGYKGYLGVEYEGEKHSEPDGIRLTKTLIERVWAEMPATA
jgi:sugar phosphate isomerase/epimerase